MAAREGLVTIRDFEAFIAQPENVDRLFELIHGEIVEKVPTEEHSLVVGDIYMELRLFVDARDLGRVTFEVRRRAKGDDLNARLPDVDFTRKERLLPVVTQGAVPQMADLIVEVKSPDDSFVKLREKANYYLNNGVQLVWIVFPATRQIEVHTNDSPVRTLSSDDEIDGGSVLPDFRVRVSAFFRSINK
jgi:Uma2 family endonuclease